MGHGHVTLDRREPPNVLFQRYRYAIALLLRLLAIFLRPIIGANLLPQKLQALIHYQILT